MSAYGQEPWARQALAALRRDWPDWGFLVVGYRWLALRGKQVVISATGPRELRYALPPIPSVRNGAQLVLQPAPWASAGAPYAGAGAASAGGGVAAGLSGPWSAGTPPSGGWRRSGR